MNDIIKIYNPANAGTLTQEQTEGLQKLTSAEIKILAQAYPNATMQTAYLLIIDSTKPVEKQLPALSSWENLWNLRERNGQRNYVAYAFRNGYKPATIFPFKKTGAKRPEVIDLSDKELMTLPGFKTFNETIPETKVEVVKVKRKKKDEGDKI